jgi:hypothetical protein
VKREDVRNFYYEATATLSEVTRQLALAGIATIWLIRTGETGGVLVYSPSLRFPLIGYVLALGCDLFQYAYKAAAWGIYNRIKERKNVPADCEFKAPALINWPAIAFFWVKVLLTVTAYVWLLSIIGGQMLK